LQDKIEAGLRDIYQHIYTHPDRKTPDSPEFAFVMGLYSPIDGHFLLMSDETITPIMPTHVCIGSGDYLGDYLARMYTGNDQGLSEVSALAIYILQQVKSYDQDCGGSSEFIVLWGDGDTSEIAKFDVFIGENLSPAFQRAITPLFYAIADHEKTDDEVERAIDIGVKTLRYQRELRKIMKKTGDQQAALMKELLKKKAQNQADSAGSKDSP
jgi:hypothetical protein